MHINKNIEKLKPYKLSTHKAWESIGDEDVLKLDWNEASCKPSPKVVHEVNNYILNGRLNWYPDVANTQLIRRLSEYTGNDENQIQYFGSSDYLQEYISLCYLDQDDKVLILGPTYDNFRVTAESVGASPEYFYLDNNFKFNDKEFIKYASKIDPKFIYICNPNNPTGTLIDSKTIESLLKKLPKSMFLIDEAYYEFSNITCAPLVNKYENIIISRTFSKAFAIAAFRVGYAISSEQNILNISKIRNSKNITQLSQIAAIAALEDFAYTKKFIDEVGIAKKEFIQSLSLFKDFGIRPINGHGNYILISLKKEHKTDLISFLENNKIFIRDYGHVKGMEDYIRITIGNSEQMNRVANTIKQFYADS